MRIVSLTSENVKRLKAVHITPDPAGNLVVIGGDNENGKTSVLDSIQMALGGSSAAPEVPVRTGEDKATIVADLGEIIVKRTFTAAGGTSLVVTNKDGLKYPSPQSLLDGLLGKLSFDPLAFIHIDAKAQVETLRRLVGLDFRQLDADRKRVYDQRTIINAQAKTAEGRVAAMPHHADVTADTVANMDQLSIRLSDATAHNNNIIVRRNDADAAEAKIKQADDYIAKCVSVIEELEKKLADAEAKHSAGIVARSEIIAKAKAAREAFESILPISTDAIIAEMQEAQTAQRKLAANQARDKAVAEAVAFKKQSDELTTQIESFDAEKKQQLGAAKFPVDGLSFTEDGVYFNGLPLAQASGAGKIRVSVAIGAALNPKVRVILVRDGSLLDTKSLALLAELAKEHNLQVWLERVGKGAECSVILEDGAVMAPTAKGLIVADEVAFWPDIPKQEDPDFEVVDGGSQ